MYETDKNNIIFFNSRLMYTIYYLSILKQLYITGGASKFYLYSIFIIR